MSGVSDVPAAPETPGRWRGTVKWFSDAKGYGFIVPDDGGPDVRVHFSQVRGPGFRYLKAGERVEFRAETWSDGLQATDVQKLAAPEETPGDRERLECGEEAETERGLQRVATVGPAEETPSPAPDRERLEEAIAHVEAWRDPSPDSPTGILLAAARRCDEAGGVLASAPLPETLERLIEEKGLEADFPQTTRWLRSVNGYLRALTGGPTREGEVDGGVSAGLSSPEPAPAAVTGRPAVWDLVIEDMRERDRSGEAKYGTRLYPGNGRDALVDAYQEALDLAVYLRQAIEDARAPRPEGEP